MIGKIHAGQRIILSHTLWWPRDCHKTLAKNICTFSDSFIVFGMLVRLEDLLCHVDSSSYNLSDKQNPFTLNVWSFPHALTNLEASLLGIFSRVDLRGKKVHLGRKWKFWFFPILKDWLIFMSWSQIRSHILCAKILKIL